MELGAEGPFSKKHKASYIFNYRKNVMSLINALGIDIGIVPSEYQDLTFKIDIPTKKFGKFSLIGIGGIGNVDINDSEEDQKDWTFTDAGENLFNGSKMGVLGLNHLFFLNKKTRIKTILSVQYAYVNTRLDTFSLENIEPFIKLGEENREVKYSFSTHLKKKISARSNMSVGIYYDIYNVMFDDSTYKHIEYVKETDIYSDLSLFRAFGEWQYKFSDNITSYAGVHYQNLLFNNTTSIEPRVGFSWKVTGNKSLNIGYGRHCQIQPRMMYFIQTLLPDNSVALTNRDLDLIKSDQVILGYDHLVNENLRVKVEAYYQSMFDVPVKENFPEYSLINSGANFFIRREDSLVNTGTAENYGVELTVERFFSTNYFVLFTASFFESKYRGSDNSERNTAFNGNYVVNALGGYEKKIGKHHLISFSLRAKLAGGKPYVPFDVEQTRSRGEVIFDWERAYKVKYSDYYRIDLRIGFKRNRPKVDIEYALDLQNVTGHKNVFMERINVKTGEIQSIFQICFYPMVTGRIQF